MKSLKNIFYYAFLTLLILFTCSCNTISNNDRIWNNISNPPVSNGDMCGTRITTDGSFLYFYLYDAKSFNLYKSDLDGLNRVLLDSFNSKLDNEEKEDSRYYVSLMNGRIIYNTNNGIFSIKADGSDKKQISNKAISDFLIVSNFIYFFDEAGLERMDEKGKCEAIDNYGAGPLSYNQDSLYYSDKDDYKILRVYDIANQKTSINKNIVKSKTGQIVYQDYIFYFDIESKEELFSYINISDGNKQNMKLPRMSGYLAAYEDSIYFISSDNSLDLNTLLYSFNIKLKTIQKICNAPCINMFGTRNGLYFNNYDKVYKLTIKNGQASIDPLPN